MELWHFDKHFGKNKRKRGLTGKHFGVFSLTHKTTNSNERFNPKMEISSAFLFKIMTLFSIFKKGRGDLPSPS